MGQAAGSHVLEDPPHPPGLTALRVKDRHLVHDPPASGREVVSHRSSHRLHDVKPATGTNTSELPEAYRGPAWETPAMRQFTGFKQSHPDCVLFFRMGDFYELFGPDAEEAHRILGITLTERTKGMPMAGVPHHAAESYLRRLVEQGIRVAVCDQVQDPKDAKGVVDRAVTRVLTPGTLVDESLLEEGRENLVAAVAPFADDRVAIAVAELSTGSFTVAECDQGGVVDLLARFAPDELVVPDPIDLDDSITLPASLAEAVGAAFHPISAVSGGVKDVRAAVERAKGLEASPARAKVGRRAQLS